MVGRTDRRGRAACAQGCAAALVQPRHFPSRAYVGMADGRWVLGTTQYPPSVRSVGWSAQFGIDSIPNVPHARIPCVTNHSSGTSPPPGRYHTRAGNSVGILGERPMCASPPPPTSIPVPCGSGTPVAMTRVVARAGDCCGPGRWSGRDGSGRICDGRYRVVRLYAVFRVTLSAFDGEGDDE
jgi:hypothetical protein